jgi:hypothetical protein
MKESYRQAEDIELVSASIAGDKLAFGEIMERYRRMLARTVKGMLGDSIFTEDVGQEVLNFTTRFLSSGERRNCRLTFRK